MLFQEIIAVYSENHTKSINTPYVQNSEVFIAVLKQMAHIVTTGLKRIR
jgi:hypothetical protein